MAIDNSQAFKTNFLLTFSRVPKVQYFLQDLIIPAINLGSIVQYTPRLDYPIPGDKLEYDPLTLSFLIDEDFDNIFEVYNWMMALRNPIAGNELNEQTDNDLADATIIVLNNNKEPKVKFTFIDCFPSSLDGALFDVSAEGDDPQVGNLVLDYSYYIMEKI